MPPRSAPPSVMRCRNVSRKSFAAKDGERVTIVEFESEKMRRSRHQISKFRNGTYQFNLLVTRGAMRLTPCISFRRLDQAVPFPELYG